MSICRILIAGFIFLGGCVDARQQPAVPPGPAQLTSIAFGSCSTQYQPQPIWDAINAARPELFIYLGDNIYADTEDMDLMRRKYEQQAQVPGFAALRQNVPVLATWDDHDYGANDAGAEYPKKVESQVEFLRFMNEPADSPRWSRPGVYESYIYGPPGRRVQIILLDTRYFRSPLLRINPRTALYQPNPDPEATVLGEAQWKWLEQQLRVPAQVRVIGSSIQVIAQDHLWEKWANFPLERQRLYRLIRDTRASGVIVISGDRHRAEISRDDEAPLPYTLWDITSSGLNQRSGDDRKSEVNRHRVGVNYVPENFGMLVIDWDRPDPVIRLEIRGMEGQTVLGQELRLSELKGR
jgi:alkaline phosphatase D